MSCTGRPKSPPLAFVSSSQIFIARIAALPLAASPPVKAMPVPILIGSAACAGGKTAAPNNSAVANSRNFRRLWPIFIDVLPWDLSSVKLRHDLLAEEADCVQHAVVRDEPAAVELGENTVEADLVAQVLQPRGNAIRGAHQHIAAQRIGIGEVAQLFSAVDEILPARAARR